MRVHSAVSTLAAVLVLASGCGGDEKTPTMSGSGSGGTSTGASAGGGGAGGAAGANTLGGTGGAGGTGGSQPQGEGGQAGAGGAAGCHVLKTGETGPHDFKQVYEAGQGTAMHPLGIEGDQVYFFASPTVLSFPVAGGTAKSLGMFYGVRPLVLGDKIYAVTQLSQEPARKLFSSPLTDLATPTTLADGLEEPGFLVADATSLYFDNKSSILRVPLGGGTPVELVPGASPESMVTHGDYLYWLDAGSKMLERVPVAGGSREPLVAQHNGWSITASDSGVYWIEIGPDAIVKWEMGADKTQVLSKTIESFGSHESLAVSGNTVFWAFGYNCGELHQVNADGTGEALITQGSSGADWIGVTDTALFVLGDIGGGLYRAMR